MMRWEKSVIRKIVLNLALTFSLTFALFFALSTGPLVRDASAINFPDACSHGTFALRDYYKQNKGCSTDADCGYFDASFQQVDPSSGGSLITDDCSVIPLLVVANVEKVEKNRRALFRMMDRATEYCSDQLGKPGCDEVKRFQLKGVAPVCLHQVCSLPPSSSLLQ